jgi:hypothetical protein
VCEETDNSLLKIGGHDEDRLQRRLLQCLPSSGSDCSHLVAFYTTWICPHTVLLTVSAIATVPIGVPRIAVIVTVEVTDVAAGADEVPTSAQAAASVSCRPQRMMPAAPRFHLKMADRHNECCQRQEWSG